MIHGVFETINFRPSLDYRLQQLCKLKYAIYADDVATSTLVNDGSRRHTLLLYHEQRGPYPIDRRFVISRAVERPRFQVVAATPRWEGSTMFLGNQLDLITPEETGMYSGYVALAGCLSPWLDKRDQFGNTGNIVECVLEEIEESTASPGLPFTDEWVPDNLAREAAFVDGRIPENYRAWR